MAHWLNPWGPGFNLIFPKPVIKKDVHLPILFIAHHKNGYTTQKIILSLEGPICLFPGVLVPDHMNLLLKDWLAGI